MTEPQVTVEYHHFKRLEEADRCLISFNQDSTNYLRYQDQGYSGFIWSVKTKDQMVLDLMALLKGSNERLSRAEDFLRTKGYNVYDVTQKR